MSDTKMRIDILTVMPEMLESPLNCSILKRAQDKGLVEIVVHNLRDYTTNRHRKVDDYPFGGDAGMVMQIEPVDRCISALKAERDYDEVIFTAPDGEQFTQPMANRLSMLDNIIILCGHYKGIDYRIREHLITKEISVGDYVLTGGEMPAAIIADAIVRLIPGAIGDEQSATRSKTICSSRPSIRARPSTRAGASPTSCSRATKLASPSGSTTRPSPAPSASAPTSSKTTNAPLLFIADQKGKGLL